MLTPDSQRAMAADLEAISARVVDEDDRFTLQTMVETLRSDADKMEAAMEAMLDIASKLGKGEQL